MIQMGCEKGHVVISMSSVVTFDTASQLHTVISASRYPCEKNLTPLYSGVFFG
uniref:Uncharacterized protein n=1 Tax=Buteo japonicus TaxID=224669 RepID=A0A8C0BST8_9AVES